MIFVRRKRIALPSATFHLFNSDGTDTGVSHTMALGTINEDCFFVVGIASLGNGSPRSISGVTIGGVSATGLYENNGVQRPIGFYGANVSNGNTGSVVVSYSGGTMLRGGAMGWRVKNLLSTTPTATSNDLVAHDPSTTTIDVQAGGIAIAIAIVNASTNYSWTGLTEPSGGDNTIEATATMSGAADAFASAQTGLTVTANQASGTSLAGMAVIAMR